MKALAAILGILGWSAVSMFAQLGPPPPIRDVVRELDVMKSAIPPSSDPAEFYANLRSAETFQSNWLQDNKGQLQRVGTLRHGLEDVLLARWAGPANYSRIKNIEMWDGALYELVIFELDPGAIASEKSIRKTLLKIMKPPPEKLRMSGPTAQELEDGFGFLRPKTSDTQRWQGLILRTPNHQVVGYDEAFFTFHEIDGRVFLVFDLGKRAGYALWPQSIYLRERFPPLATSVQAWTKERLLTEITTPEQQNEGWDPKLMGRHLDEFRLQRDRVLVAEMVRRGLDPGEFQAIMDAPYGRDLLIQQLRIAGETERYSELILQTICRYENFPDVNQDFSLKVKGEPVRSHLAEVIMALAWPRGGPDFSETMLELAVAGHEPELALNYVQERLFDSHIRFDNPHSQELADKLAAAKVPAAAEHNRDFIVKWIRSKHSN